MKIAVPVFTYIVMVALVTLGLAPASHAQQCANWAAKIVSLEGKGSVKRENNTNWKAVSFGEVFCYGDTLRITEFRAALRLENDSFVRLNQGTTIRFLPPDRAFYIELLEGIAHFLSRTPNKFIVKTPYINAAVEGTEFIIQHHEGKGLISVFEGQVIASNQHGRVRIGAMEQSSFIKSSAPTTGSSISLRETATWALHTPPMFIDTNKLPSEIGKAISLGNFGMALSNLNQEKYHKNIKAQNAITSISLYGGRANLARTSNNRALKLDPVSADALANSIFISLLNGEPNLALDNSNKLVELYPKSLNAQLVFSYALQASGQLEAALNAALSAKTIQPSALTDTRVTELALVLNKKRLAKSVLRNIKPSPLHLPYISYLRATIALQNNANRKALTILNNSINKDPNIPHSHFLLGLTKIRLNNIEEGRKNIELAVTLNPGNSLYRSYLSRAFSELHSRDKAIKQINIAKTLDSNDPTPWFYLALEQQSDNKLIESLNSYSTSLKLNGGRSMYRSKPLLEHDAAARISSLGQIYNSLGFQEQAIKAGTDAITLAPSSYSGHRLLAKAYRDDHSRETLRSAERLIATVHQPLGSEILPQGLSESDLKIIDGAGPADLGISEYNAIFIREGVSGRLKALGGTQDTSAYDLSVRGLIGPVSMTGNRYRYRQDGFRKNNDSDYTLSNIYTHWAPVKDFGVQLEFSERQNTLGDRSNAMIHNLHSDTLRQKLSSNSYRVTSIYQINQNSKVLFNTAKKKISNSGRDTFSIFDSVLLELYYSDASTGKNNEIQFIYEKNGFNFVTGYLLTQLEQDSSTETRINEFDLQPISDVSDASGSETLNQVYIQSDFKIAKNFNASAYIEHIKIKQEAADDSQLDIETKKSYLLPKAGFIFKPLNKLTIRSAYFETASNNNYAPISLAPTHISGIPVIYDLPIAGTKTKNIATITEWRIKDHQAFGLNTLSQDIEYPELNTGMELKSQKHEYNSLNIFYNKIFNHSTIHASIKKEEFTSQDNHTFSSPIKRGSNITANIDYTKQCRSRSLIKISANYLLQETLLENFDYIPVSSTENLEEFILIDAELEYRLKNNTGSVQIIAKNIFDQSFKYIDFQKMQSSAIEHGLAPQRMILVSLSYHF